MKVCLVKQALDAQGPWRSISWSQSDPLELLDCWPGSLTLWEMTGALQADWIIIPQQPDDNCAARLGRTPALTAPLQTHTKGVVPLETAGLEKYDLVITLDPILSAAPSLKGLKTVFAFMANQSTGPDYTQYLMAPMPNYDLFLAHGPDGAEKLEALPASIFFPFPGAPEFMRRFFDSVKEDALWLESKTARSFCAAAVETCMGQLAAEFAMPVKFIPEMALPSKASEPPDFKENRECLKELGRFRFYATIYPEEGGRIGLRTAAALGSICFGHASNPCHRLVCDPRCLIRDAADFRRVFAEVSASPVLQGEILAVQENNLLKKLSDAPLALLRDACSIKQTGRPHPAAPKLPLSGAAFTLFASARPFHEKHRALIQNNAFKSWTRLRPRPDVILFGNEEGSAEAARKYGFHHEPEIRCNEFNTPYVNYLFEKAEELSSTPVLGYINSDIILLQDFVDALQLLQREAGTFLMIGRRWDTDIDFAVDFEDSQVESILRKLVAERGKLHRVGGIDYFMYTKGVYQDIPPFALGRRGWDNWLVYGPLHNGKPIVDATGAVCAIHQNHDLPYGEKGHIAGGIKGVEITRNCAMVKGKLGTVADAKLKLVS